MNEDFKQTIRESKEVLNKVKKRTDEHLGSINKYAKYKPVECNDRLTFVPVIEANNDVIKVPSHIAKLYGIPEELTPNSNIDERWIISHGECLSGGELARMCIAKKPLVDSYQCFIHKDWDKNSRDVIIHEDRRSAWKCLLEKAGNPKYAIVIKNKIKPIKDE